MFAEGNEKTISPKRAAINKYLKDHDYVQVKMEIDRRTVAACKRKKINMSETCRIALASAAGIKMHVVQRLVIKR